MALKGSMDNLLKIKHYTKTKKLMARDGIEK
jgi:hypothetical protein